MAAAELGDLLGRSAEIGEQPTQCRGALDPELRAEHSEVGERHRLGRETSALYEVHANAAGLEKRSRHEAPTALRIPLVASLADDLVSVVTEPLAGCERATGFAVECRLHCGTFTRLPFAFLSARHRTHARSLASCLKVEK